LVFADVDDAGASRLVSNLAKRLEVTWWRFGLPESEISVHVDDGTRYRLEQPNAKLTPDVLRKASVIIYRRRLLQPRPLVVSNLPSPEDRGFSEREWSSLLHGLLLSAERNSQPTWINKPSATLVTENKLSLLLLAVSYGLPVPPFSISTPVRLPQTRSDGLVAKAISSDERIDATRHFSTALIPSQDLRDLPGADIPTPSLLQQYIQPRVELRVFYALGEFLSLELTPSDEHVDIRHVPRDQLAVRPCELPAELREGLVKLTHALDLAYCTFDLVVPRDGPPALVDITPNGDWDYFESDAHPTVSDFLADVIVAHVGHGL
jgi:hypothetical protein